MAICTGQRCPMQVGYQVEQCEHTDCPYRTKPHTNADRIRAMDDEILAVQLTHVFHEGVIALTGVELPDEILDEFRSHILDKLQQPAEVE